MKDHIKKSCWFVAVGLILYTLLFYGAENLVYRYGHSNPFYKIATTERASFDYAILGASHAMPFDFSDVNSYMEERTGTNIINLATPGGGIVYNRFVLDHFLQRNTTKNVLYIIDSFAFYSIQWNEGRFDDIKILRRTPFDPALARLLLAYTRREGVSFRVFLDYVTGFSKINNHDRFEIDMWEGEKKFDRKYRFSRIRDKKRIRYLYPSEKLNEEVLDFYLAKFVDMTDLLESKNINLIVIKTPIPTHIYELIPHEGIFDRNLTQILMAGNIDFYDFSLVNNDKKYFFDTDHLNRQGVMSFFENHLKDILIKSASQ